MYYMYIGGGNFEKTGLQLCKNDAESGFWNLEKQKINLVFRRLKPYDGSESRLVGSSRSTVANTKHVEQVMT